MLFPIAVDVPMPRWPWMNWVMMAAVGLCSITFLVRPESMVQLVLGIGVLELVEESPFSWVGHMFLHADLWHLAGNLVFMWVFGNAVCAKIGNAAYPVLWVGCGLIAALTEQVLGGPAPMLGASGAIAGATGFYLVFYALNDVAVFYFFWFVVIVRTGTFSVAGYWVILISIGFDILGVALGGGGIAYLAHLGGYATGAAAALGLLLTGLLEPSAQERTLIDIFKGRGSPGRATRRGATPSDLTARLQVHVGDGEVQPMMVADLLRRHPGGEADAILVSEDGVSWLPFAEWRARRRR